MYLFIHLEVCVGWSSLPAKSEPHIRVVDENEAADGDRIDDYCHLRELRSAQQQSRTSGGRGLCVWADGRVSAMKKKQQNKLN